MKNSAISDECEKKGISTRPDGPTKLKTPLYEIDRQVQYFYHPKKQ